MSTLQFRERIHERARKGERLSDEEIAEITRESAELAGADSGPTEEVNPQQAQWATQADKVLSKPANRISRVDASDLHSKEARAFENLPAQGSVASHVQSIADKNERP
ncbi:hypothetical protein VTN77DRAFT_6867 [Rasamsonia byssochlamydoides]|uniref:uncharacterized protein n=1 Tax=Rasamsonia byssochlamydoides TaxID=89139 RepID=UPI003742DFE7